MRARFLWFAAGAATATVVAWWDRKESEKALAVVLARKLGERDRTSAEAAARLMAMEIR